MPFDKKQLLLYAVTDRSLTCKKTLLEQVEDALKGGVTMLQLREKNLEEEAYIKEAMQMKKLCRRYRVPLIINDNVTVALKSGADGVHVGIEDMPVAEIRKQAPKGFLIGATAKTVKQAKQAEADGADYLGAGAVFSSPTKKNAVRITKETLFEISSSVAIPTVAIGGIHNGNLARLKGCGICGIAVVSAIFGSDDATAAAKSLRKSIAMLTADEADGSCV